METVYQRVNKDGKKEKKIKKEVREEVITVYEKPDSASKDSEIFKSDGTVSEVNEKSSQKVKKKARHVISATSSENGSKLTKINEESIDDLEDIGRKQHRARINSADRDVIDSLQNQSKGRQRSESSDHINVKNTMALDEKMPDFVTSSSLLAKKAEQCRKEEITVKPKPRKFMHLNKIEECDEEMEDNEAFVPPPPKAKSRRRTRSSRWANAVGSCELKRRNIDEKDESQKTLELLKQFQTRKIHIENGIIPEEEECESSSDGDPSVNPVMSNFFKSTSSPTGIKKQPLGYLYISKKHPRHKKNMSYSGASVMSSIEGKANVIRDINQKLSSLRKNKPSDNPNLFQSAKKRQSLETKNTPSKLDFSSIEAKETLEKDNSTVKKPNTVMNGFKDLNDSCETKYIDSYHKEPRVKINRELFRNSKDDTTIEKTEQEEPNDHIITHFNFNINDVKEDTNHPKSCRGAQNPTVYSEFLSKTKRQIEKSKHLTKSSPKIGKTKNAQKSRSGRGLTTLKFQPQKLNYCKTEEEKKKSLPKFDRENIRKIKLRLHELRIDPKKMPATNFQR